MIKDIRELDGPPVIGRYYWVPCVERRENSNAYGLDENGFAPVMGDAHRDERIDFPWLHWHYDWRFVKLSWDIRFGIVCNIEAVHSNPDLYIQGPFPLQEPQPKRKVCTREVREFPAALAHMLEPSYRETRARTLEGCLVCPHQGYRINSVFERNGAVVCPLHGLKWDLKSGALVAREKKR